MTIHSTSLKKIVSQLGYRLKGQVPSSKLMRKVQTGDFYTRVDAMMTLERSSRRYTPPIVWNYIVQSLERIATGGKTKCIRTIASRSLYKMGERKSVPSAMKRLIWYFKPNQEYYLKVSNIRISRSTSMACYYKYFKACMKKHSAKPQECTGNLFYPHLNAKQGRTTLKRMKQIALSRSVQKKHIPIFQFHLRNYMQSNVNFSAGRARKGLVSLRKALSGIGVPRRGSLTQKRIRHLVHLAYLAAYYGEKAWSKSDDRQVLSAYLSLERAVFKDGKADSVELRTIAAVNQNIRGVHPLGGRGELIANLQLGYRFPNKTSKSVHLKPLPHRAYPNIGTKRLYVWRAKRLPKGYRKLAKTDPRLKGRPTHLQCFSFALSKPAAFFARTNMNRSYRRLDLSKERARKGDLVVYFSLQPEYLLKIGRANDVIPSGLNLHHAGVVTLVNSKGFPTRAMGQFGIRRPIYEHPVAQAPLMYGSYWMVLRKKPAKKP